MKAIFALLLAVLVTGCSHRYDFDKSLVGRPLPGHFVRDACDGYADEVRLALFQNGIDCIKVVFDWQFAGQSGRHAMVLFYRDGVFFGIDNGTAKPKQLFGTTDLELVRSFRSYARSMVDVDSLLPAAPRPVDQLFDLGK